MFKFLTFLFLISPFLGFSQIKISGKVVDQKNMPIVGANILIKATNKGTATNQEGFFELEISQFLQKLIFSAIGFQSFEKNIDQNQVLEIVLAESILQTNEVIVFGKKEYPITQTEIEKVELQKNNLGQDLPILLNFSPSVVTTTDAGAGVGYTSMRVRGSDGTRTNVTINGIPLNDAESQGVFWVNMPDFASTVNRVQLQRGVGTSSNGAGAFGASLNLETDQAADQAYFQTDNSVGSFNTFKHTLKAGTGLLNNRFGLDVRLSKINSDGFIDRSFSDLKSFYVSAKYLLGKGQLTTNIFSGTERTYQAWNGVPEEVLKTGNRTYNELTYENEVDNYQQDHYQILYKVQLNEQFRLHTALHYTKGRGYYEQYKTDEKLEKYGLEPLTIGNESIKKSDLIRRRWLDNDFYGGVFQLNYQKSTRLDIDFGGAWNQYKGKHFGEVIWAKFMSNGTIRHRYYDNDATKTDFNVYAKANFQPFDRFFVFADVQFRNVNYTFLGFDNQLRNVKQAATMAFFNPKVGLRYKKDKHNLYASYSVGNKEPNRDDFTQSTPNSRPKYETLHNVEAGYEIQLGNIAFQLNYYLMNYQNQLILTGKINDVGAYIRTNVAKSYRTGIEISANYLINSKLEWKANATFSQNKLQEFTEFLDNYDDGTQQSIDYRNTDIAFSPNFIAASDFRYKVFTGFELAFLSKYVGKQFLDNTSSDSRKLDAYFTNDLRVVYGFSSKYFKNLSVTFLFNNLFDVKYESNGYTFGYISEQQISRVNYFYPQAGRNFLMGMSVRF